MEHRIKILADIKGKSCDGCSRCCEGWLVTTVFNYPIGPNYGGCKFLGKCGCSVYDARPYDPCQTFQCGWKENTRIPDFMKPDRSNIILLVRWLDSYFFYRMVKCGDVPKYVYDWAKDYSRQGNHLLGYDDNNELLIFSEDYKFRQLAEKQFTVA
jgi:hypothetical protein